MTLVATCAFCSHRYKDRLFCPRCGHPGGLAEDKPKRYSRLLSEVQSRELPRIQTGPWDHCFGPCRQCDACRDSETLPCPHKGKDGIVISGATLIGGIAGAGKSTLSLVLADAIAQFYAEAKREVLYIAAEEDDEQVADRAHRIGIKHLDRIRILPTLAGMEALSEMEPLLEQYKPCAVFLDSLTGLMDKDLEGAVTICKVMKRISAKNKCPSIIIDQATKQDDFHGLYKLQHTVDTTMILSEVEEFLPTKVSRLTTIKNRFGRAYVSVDIEVHESGIRVFEGVKDE